MFWNSPFAIVVTVGSVVAFLAMRARAVNSRRFFVGSVVAVIWALIPWGFYFVYPVQTKANYNFYPEWNQPLFRLSFLPFNGPSFHRIPLTWVITSSIFNAFAGLALARFIALRKGPNHVPDPTPAPVTPAAEPPARQP